MALGALGALGALALVGASGCGRGAKTAPVSAGRPAPELTTPSPAGAAARPPEQRSQPWWQPVITFKGDASTRTAAFTVDDAALQWRVSWHCTNGSFDITGSSESGAALRRPLAHGASCPQDGKGFSSKTGRFVLQVTASGPWQAVIEQQVDAPLVEPPLPGMAGAKILDRGTVYDVDKKGKGTVVVYQLGDGSRVLRLEDFYVSINSDLEIRLSPLPAPKTTVEAVSAPFKPLAPLKATVGSMNYPIPPEIDITKFHSIVIWCELTHNAYAAAGLTS